jgi:hypothetical protein
VVTLALAVAVQAVAVQTAVAVQVEPQVKDLMVAQDHSCIKPILLQAVAEALAVTVATAVVLITCLVQVAQELLQVLLVHLSPALAVEEDLMVVSLELAVVAKAAVVVVATVHRALAMVVVLAWSF